MQPAFAGDDRAVAEVARPRLGLERRRHHDDAQLGPNGLLHQPDHAEGEVAVQAAFVELVEDDDAGRFEERIVVQHPQQDAGRDDQDARGRPALLVEADVIADLARRAAVPRSLGHAPGRGAGGQPARLQHDDALPSAGHRAAPAARASSCRRRSERGSAGSAAGAATPMISGRTASIGSAGGIASSYPDRESPDGVAKLVPCHKWDLGSVDVGHVSPTRIARAHSQRRNASLARRAN